MLQFALELLFICEMIAFCFYDTQWAMLLFLPLYPFYFRYRANIEKKNRIEKLRQEFKEFMVVTAASLSAGYSMENALKASQKELPALLGEKSEMIKALNVINRRVALNEPVEKVILEFGRSAGVDDIESFAEIFAYAKRSGGDYAAIMRRTASVLQEKIETSRDIQTVISQKKLEARIMDFVPVGIILYLRVSSPLFLSGLYGSLIGVLIMTACLVVYILAVLFSEKIVDLRI